MMKEEFTTEIRIILTVLLICFVALKLTGAVDWSWHVVLLPIIIPAALFILFLGMYMIVVVAIKLPDFKPIRSGTKKDNYDGGNDE